MAPDPETSHFLLGAQLFNGDVELGEVDLLGFDGADLVCGEVKTSASGLTGDEVAKTFELARAIKADVVVFGCMTELPDTTIESILVDASDCGFRARLVTPSGVQVSHQRPVPTPPMT